MSLVESFRKLLAAPAKQSSSARPSAVDAIVRLLKAPQGDARDPEHVNEGSEPARTFGRRP